MKTVVVLEEDALKLICGYAPQRGRSLAEKQSLYDEPKCEWDMHSAGCCCCCQLTSSIAKMWCLTSR